MAASSENDAAGSAPSAATPATRGQCCLRAARREGGMVAEGQIGMEAMQRRGAADWALAWPAWPVGRGRSEFKAPPCLPVRRAAGARPT